MPLLKRLVYHAVLSNTRAFEDFRHTEYTTVHEIGISNDNMNSKDGDDSIFEDHADQ